ncbi:tetratricopeptide repeat protein [Tolypothrix sp. FACHB-123]|uniref:CHAT domain-containing protein n=1 Tax=Tolypothrix sp. FACHB-123 TaxID=2692868 RepID=UPI0016831A99|nr:tetratricopeptide repeat protein [Tolypothrix sp. FACHB-123]MBD2353121.1 tetratricopeptide repeat protein [Tolypothrix sp. FACHB-123]
MRFHKIGLSFLALVIATVSTPINFSLWETPGELPALAQTPQARKAEADRLFKQGIQQYQTSQFEAALRSWQQALIIYREIKVRKGESNTLGNLGIAYFSLGDYPKAIEYHQQRLAIAKEIKDRFGEGQSLGNLGIAYYALGDYPKAIQYQQQSLAIAKEVKDRLGEGQSLGNLGLAYRALGDYPKAIKYYQQFLAIAKEVKDRLGQRQSLGYLGGAYHALGDYSKAIEYHSQSLAIAKEIKDRLGEGKSLGNLGIAYYSLGDYPKAIEYQLQSLAIAKEIKDRLGEGQSLGNLGNAYYSLGDYPKAIEYQLQSLAIAKEIKDRLGEGRSLGNLGIAYYALGNYPKAIEYYQQYLAIAKAVKDRLGEGNALGNLGLVYNTLGNYPKAIDYLQQRLAIAKEIKDKLGEAISLNNLGYTFYKQGNLAAAEKTLYEGIKVYESLRDQKLADTNKVSFFDTQSNTYRTLQQVLIAQNKTDAALEIAERGRARAFVELLASRVSTNNKQTDTSPPAPTIAEIKQIAKQQNATLVQYSIITDNFQVAGKDKFQESYLYIWVVKPTGEVTFRKVDIKSLWQKDNTTLAELVNQSRLGIGVVRGARAGGIIAQQNPDAVNVNKPLQKLYDILIKDIADLLPKNPNDRVIFIPQSSLFLAPFPALRDEQGKYLVEKHTIMTAPAIQVLDFTHKLGSGRQINYNNALIVGNPTMPVVSTEPGKPATQLSSLPGAELEAKTIAKMLKTQPILGKEAEKANILQRLSSVDVIHLATHGWADDYRGLGSWIAFAPSANDDGLLKAEEILDLKLKAQLVVLSACETGKGKLSGDGVIGLSRSLISAGVPSVLVSLWQVPDEPTQYLMVEFYRSLQTQPDKALALRQAMLKTKQKFPNPVNWAAFTLIGNS